MMPFAWRHKLVLAMLLLTLPATAAAGEQIPAAEIQALERVINREASSSQLGSQTLGDLMQLKFRLIRLQKEFAEQPRGRQDRSAALEPLAGDDSLAHTLERLEAEAKSGGRAARRTLALYYMYLNEPEKALQEWRRMGKTTDYDIQYLLISAYLEFALGEYNAGRENLEQAIRFMDTRTSLSLSTPVLCQTIAGYRIYIPLPASDLLPGNEVLLYTEVEGAVFQSTPDGGSECDIMFGLRLKNESQSTLWAEPNYGAYTPVFAGPIRDLHVALTWRIPNDLAPGRYYLFVEATEETTKRRGESVLGFNVGKRETSQPPGLSTGGAMSPEIRKMMREAQRQFPGAAMPENMDNTWETRDKDQFEMLRDYQRGQRGF